MSDFFQELSKYAKERLTVNYLLIVPIYLFILIIDGKIGWFSPLILIAFLFFYRLLDDLSDLKFYKRTYPGRVLTRTKLIKEFNSFLLLLSLILLYFVFNHSDRASMKLYLPALTVLSFYRHKAPKLFWLHFHLLKYPLLLLLLGYQNLIALFTLYAGLISFEFYQNTKYGEIGKKYFAVWISLMITAILLLLLF